ncbi:MAG: 50S ribosomal protein L4 [Deltaproteobacteria bacterium]
MTVVSVYDQNKKKVGDLNLDDRVFNVPLKKHLIYDAVIAQRENHRRGTASTKTRAQVSGGGKKPFRQKGTGRARQGSSRSPLQVGGGAAFGPKPKTYKYRLPRKVIKAALRTALSAQLRENKLVVLKDFKLEKIKTKALAAILKKFSLEKGLLVDESNDTLEKSSANLRLFKFLRFEGINVYDLLKFQNLLVTESAILGIEKRLQP